MVVAGALFILVEGILEVGILNQGTAYGLPVPPSIWAVPVFTIILALLLLYLAWIYVDAPSGRLGVVFMALGVLSFVLGAGFLVGGILIIIAGALACFADWVQKWVDRWYGYVRPRTTDPSSSVRSADLEGAPSTETPRPSRSAKSADIVVYRPCPSCGQLNRREFTVCSTCGKPLPS